VQFKIDNIIILEKYSIICQNQQLCANDSKNTNAEGRIIKNATQSGVLLKNGIRRKTRKQNTNTITNHFILFLFIINK
jgi:hypothetical protein